METVGYHQELVQGEQGGEFALVGLELLPGVPYVGVLVGRVLEFDDAEGQPVQEQDDVGRRVDWFSFTVNWLTASQSLLSGFSKSATAAGTPVMVPSGPLTGTVTPRVRARWKTRFRVSRVGPSGLIRLRRPASSADAGSPG